jgi:hypothetical protein
MNAPNAPLEDAIQSIVQKSKRSGWYAEESTRSPPLATSSLVQPLHQS